MVKPVTPSSVTDATAGTVVPLLKAPTDRIRELPVDTTMAFVVMDDTELADFLIVCSCCGGGDAPAAVQVSVGVRLTLVPASLGTGVLGIPGRTVTATLPDAFV
jgi:hypothetical protein